MGREDDTTTVNGVYLFDTGDAVLIVTDCGEKHWIPVSCCDFNPTEDLRRGEKITLEVQTWFCEKEGIE